MDEKAPTIYWTAQLYSKHFDSFGAKQWLFTSLYLVWKETSNNTEWMGWLLKRPPAWLPCLLFKLSPGNGWKPSILKIGRWGLWDYVTSIKRQATVQANPFLFSWEPGLSVEKTAKESSRRKRVEKYSYAIQTRKIEIRELIPGRHLVVLFLETCNWSPHFCLEMFWQCDRASCNLANHVPFPK